MSQKVHRKAYNTNQSLQLHLHEDVGPIGTARLARPSLTDELFRSEEDEDTSRTANTDPKKIQTALTIYFRGRKVFLSVKSVVAGGVREDRGGVAVDIHFLPEILRDMNYEYPPTILHSIIPSTHVNDLWYLGCILYHRISID